MDGKSFHSTKKETNKLFCTKTTKWKEEDEKKIQK